MRFSLSRLFFSTALAVTNVIHAQDFSSPQQKFADEIYDQSHNEFRDLKTRKEKGAILATLGVERYDIPYSAYGFEWSEEEPAVQGVYAATSWLLAAKNTIGADKVVLAIGLNQKTIQEYREKILCKSLNAKEAASPFPYILELADLLKIKVTPIDCDPDSKKNRIIDVTSEQYEKIRDTLSDVINTHPDHVVIAVYDAEKAKCFLGLNEETEFSQSSMMCEFPHSIHAIAADWGQHEIEYLKRSVPTFADRIKGPLLQKHIENNLRLEQHDMVAEKKCVSHIKTPECAQYNITAKQMVDAVLKAAESYESRERTRNPYQFLLPSPGVQ